MFLTSGKYTQATRHPWSCVLFVLPLLVIYEAGLMLLRSSASENLRNGADTWMRSALVVVGLEHFFWAPLLLLVILMAWSFLHRQPWPKDIVGVWIGMAAESGAFALLLWGLSQGLWPIFNGLASLPAMATASASEPAIEQIVSFVGAGIYEETLFRLLLFSGLSWVFYLGEFPRVLSFLLAASGSALLFAGAHHLGPHGEAFNAYVFAFRTTAGLYFAALYQLRGFGIAVGAHTGYDVLVGVIVHMA